MTEPLTDERFEQIKTDWAPTGEGYDVGGGHFSTTPPPEVQDVLDLIAEVDRLRALTTITEEMVERAAEAFYTALGESYGAPTWGLVCTAFPDTANTHRRAARAALEAILNGGEQA